MLGAVAAWPQRVQAQQPRQRRVGVVIEGETYNVGVDGLRGGLRAFGLSEGSQLALLVRDAKGDRRAIEDAARTLERDDKVDLIVALATSVARAVKRSTMNVPIVFVTGSDPVALGLVETVARPGGRLTGVHSISSDLTAKRLELLRECVPTIRRVVTFYNPSNASAVLAVGLAREAAQRLGLDIIEQHVGSTEQVRDRLRELTAGQADAYFFGSDAMVNSMGGAIVERANALRMPVVGFGLDLVRNGALLGYGFSYQDLGRRAARYVARILSGASPADLPVEAASVPALAVNLDVAKRLGIVVPLSILDRANEVIE
jgi:putative ABC transport system substrate-binding protein